MKSEKKWYEDVEWWKVLLWGYVIVMALLMSDWANNPSGEYTPNEYYNTLG